MTQPDSPEDILELFRKQCVNKGGGIGFEETLFQLNEYYTNKFMEIVDKTEAGQYGEEADFALSDIRQAIKQLSKRGEI